MNTEKVFVYRNLIKKQFSIRDLASGHVTDADEVWLSGATFVVSQAGRLRMLREGRRNIHAGVVGTLLKQAPRGARCDVAVRYHPNEGPYFTTTGDQAIHKAPLAHLVDGAVYIPEEVRWL
jgi:hypothetical protein